MNEFSINWIFLVDSLNFSFWSDLELGPAASTAIDQDAKSLANVPPRVVEKYTVIYNQIPYHGYWALCAAVNRALDVNVLSISNQI